MSCMTNFMSPQACDDLSASCKAVWMGLKDTWNWKTDKAGVLHSPSWVQKVDSHQSGTKITILSQTGLGCGQIQLNYLQISVGLLGVFAFQRPFLASQCMVFAYRQIQSCNFYSCMSAILLCKLCLLNFGAPQLPIASQSHTLWWSANRAGDTRTLGHRGRGGQGRGTPRGFSATPGQGLLQSQPSHEIP